MSLGSEQNTKRKYLLMLIFAPGIFFILFWAATRFQAPESATVEPPDTYVELGTRVERDGAGYLVYRGEKLFSGQIDLGNNLAMAEPGRVFVALGLSTNVNVPDGAVSVIDSKGVSYSPLRVERELVARNFGFAGAGDRLYIFKVDSRAGEYYFVINIENPAAWRFANEE